MTTRRDRLRLRLRLDGDLAAQLVVDGGAHGRFELDDFAVGRWLHVERLDTNLWHVRVGNQAMDVHVDGDRFEVHNQHDLGDL